MKIRRWGGRTFAQWLPWKSGWFPVSKTWRRVRVECFSGGAIDCLSDLPGGPRVRVSPLTFASSWKDVAQLVAFINQLQEAKAWLGVALREWETEKRE